VERTVTVWPPVPVSRLMGPEPANVLLIVNVPPPEPKRTFIPWRPEKRITAFEESSPRSLIELLVRTANLASASPESSTTRVLPPPPFTVIGWRTRSRVCTAVKLRDEPPARGIGAGAPPRLTNVVPRPPSESSWGTGSRGHGPGCRRRWNRAATMRRSCTGAAVPRRRGSAPSWMSGRLSRTTRSRLPRPERLDRVGARPRHRR